MNEPVVITNWTTGLPLMVPAFSVTRSMAQTFSTTSLTLRKTVDIRMQDEVDVALPAEFVFTGTVTDMNFGDENTVEVSLESGAGILAMSDAEPTQWENNTARELIEGVCEEFGVPVSFDPLINPDAVPAGVSIDVGNRALGAITDVCHRNGWVLLDDPIIGGLIVTVVGKESHTVALVRGVAPLISLQLQVKDQRIKTTRANRQIPGKARRGKKLIEDIDLWGQAVDNFARAGTKRYIRSDTAMSEKELGYLAAATSLIEGAGGVSITATVNGFSSPDGSGIWKPNKLILVIDPENRIDAYPALIEAVTLTQTADAAQRATLTLVPPAKYLSADALVSGAVLTDPFAGLRIWR